MRTRPMLMPGFSPDVPIRQCPGEKAFDLCLFHERHSCQAELPPSTAHEYDDTLDDLDDGADGGDEGPGLWAAIVAAKDNF